mgnify:CR=1 FL=1
MNWIARIVMGLLGLVLLTGLIAALGLYIVFATVRWLLTGRKPKVVMVWQQFSALRKGMAWRAGQGDAFGAKQTVSGDVIDVEVREVREPISRLPDDRGV